MKKHYGIEFNQYAIFMHYSVTTELNKLSKNIKEVTKALIESEKNYIVIYPNNDEGSELILEALCEGET